MSIYLSVITKPNLFIYFFSMRSLSPHSLLDIFKGHPRVESNCYFSVWTVAKAGGYTAC